MGDWTVGPANPTNSADRQVSNQPADECADDVMPGIRRRIEERLYDRFDVIRETAGRILESGDL